MSEITKNGDLSATSLPGWAWSLVGILMIIMYFFGLGLPFFGPDEPRYAQVAREMFERGDWITPTLGGYPWFEKPALLYWSEIVSFNVFGVSEFSARLGPTFFGLGTIISLWILGRHIPNDIAISSTSFARWLALISASTLGIIVFSRGASFDITLTFPMTAAMVSFFVYDRCSQIGKLSWFPLVIFYLFVGMAILAKGLVGVLLPFGIVALYQLLSRRMPSRQLMTSLIWGTIIAAVVASTWYLPMSQRHGWQFIDEFFIQHHFQRFTSNKYQHPQPFYFYLWVLPLMTLPWMPFFLGGIWTLVRNALEYLATRTRPTVPISPVTLFALSWLIVPVLFFSFSGSKLPGYVLPAVPAAMIIATHQIFELINRSRRWRLGTFAVAAAVPATVVVLLATAVPRFADVDSVKGLILSASERGYENERVYGLHMISHSAEYYAAGRLLRDPEGRQKKLYGPSEVSAEMQRTGVRRALVLVPIEHLKQLMDSTVVRSEVIRDNTEIAIVAVSLN